MAIATKTITAQDTFSDPVTVAAGMTVDVGIAGTFTANVVVQCRRPDFDSNNWNTVATYTSAGRYSSTPHGSNWEYRVGVETGGFTSGTIQTIIATPY